MIDADDIGRYGLLAFREPERLNRREIDIAGDEPTLARAAAILSEAWHRSIEFVPVPLAEVRKASPEAAIMYEWFDRVGYGVHIASTAKEFGIAPSTLADWARRHPLTP